MGCGTKSFLDEIEDFVANHLSGHEFPSQVEGIQDTLYKHGLFQPYEISILKTPLVNRLRFIHQTAFTYLLTPSATHTRLEHSLGTVQKAEKVLNAMSRKSPSLVDDRTRIDVRLAALLHDVGHGMFSHSSESYYASFPEIEMLSKSDELQFAAPHEINSFFIIQSKSFRDLIVELEKRYELRIDVEEISKYVIGRAEPSRQYLVELINGPFDADKLEYIERDSLHFGLPMSIDTTQLINSTSIVWTPNDYRLMAISEEALPTVELLLFFKMHVHNSIFRSPVVRGAECLFKSILDYVRRNHLQLAGRSMDRVVDFLYTHEHDLLSEAKRTSDSGLQLLINRFMNGDLPVACFTISRETVSDDFMRQMALDPSRIALKSSEVQTEIFRAAGEPCLENEIMIDIPVSPLRFLSHIHLSHEGKICRVEDVSPILYNIERSFVWRGYIFCPRKFKEEIGRAAKRVLEERGWLRM